MRSVDEWQAARTRVTQGSRPIVHTAHNENARAYVTASSGRSAPGLVSRARPSRPVPSGRLDTSSRLKLRASDSQTKGANQVLARSFFRCCLFLKMMRKKRLNHAASPVLLSAASSASAVRRHCANKTRLSTVRSRLLRKVCGEVSRCDAAETERFACEEELARGRHHFLFTVKPRGRLHD